MASQVRAGDSSQLGVPVEVEQIESHGDQTAGDEEEEWHSHLSHECMYEEHYDHSLDPKSTCLRIWQTFICIMLTIDCLLITLMAAFDSTGLAEWVITYFCDACLFVDIIIQFRTGYVDNKGILVTDLHMIARRYASKLFIVDLLSIIPLDIGAVCFKETSVWKALTLLRLNRLLSVYKTMQYFDNRLSELGSNQMRLRYSKYALVSLLSTHSLTCVWFTLACTAINDVNGSHIRTCSNESWASNPNFNLGFDMRNTSTMNAYVVSLYWAVATATSTGYGDIYASSFSEMWFAICAMFIGIGVFFGMLLGGMTSMLTNQDSKRSKYVHRLNVIKTHLEEKSVAEDLCHQVVGYYEFLWQRKRGTNDEGIYMKLPLTFQAEISYRTTSSILGKAVIFQGLSEGFLRMLSLNIRHVLLLPKQIIIKRGEVGSQMYFIHRGVVEILAEDDEDTAIATLKSGKLFGEVSLIYSMPRTATIRAATHCDLMVLDKFDLNTILIHYPDVSEKLKAVAKSRCGAADGLLQSEDHVDDGQAAKFKALQQRRTSFVPPVKSSRSAFQPASDTGRLSFSVTKKVDHVPVTESFEIIRNPDEEIDEIGHLVSVHHPSIGVRMAERIRWLKKLIDQTTLNPTSGMSMIWNNLIVTITFFICIIYPYMACFTSYSARKGYDSDTPSGPVLLGLTYAFDFFLLFDIVVTLRTNVHTKNGVSSDIRDIVRQHCLCWQFVLDIIAILPSEILCFVAPANDIEQRWRLFSLLRLNRLFKCTKVYKHLHSMESMLNVSVGLTRMLKLAMYVILLTHWVACVLYSVACYGDECIPRSWIVNWAESKRNLTDVMEYNVTKPSTEYVTSVYWAAATMTSTGYGDISAHTTLGRVFSLLSMLVGLLLYGYCLSLMAATLANFDAPKVQFQERLFAIRNFMQERQLGQSLRKRVITQLSLLWAKYKGEWLPGDKDLCHEVPYALRQDIALDDAQKILTHIPLFSYTDDSFLRSLALRGVTYAYSPGDVIVYAGDMGREMYCIRKGFCLIVTPDRSQILATIGPGQYFGEIGMMFGDYRTATVLAKTHAEVVMITNEDLAEVLNDYPILEEQFEMAVANKKFLRNLQEISRERIQKMLAQEESVQHQCGAAFCKDESPIPNTSWRVFCSRFSDGTPNEEYVEPFKTAGFLKRMFGHLLLRRTLLPQGKVLKVWTCMMMVMAILNALLVPAHAGFLPTNPYVWAICYILDIFSFVNLYLGFHFGFYNEMQIEVSHPLATAAHYLKTNFSIDLLACFPIEVFAYCAFPEFTDNSLQLFAICRINRCLQIYLLPLGFNYQEARVDKEVGSIRAAKFFFYVMIFMNWLTCTIFIMACPPMMSATGGYETLGTGHQCWDSSWIHRYRKTELNSLNSAQLYAISLYWACATAVSVGYGEISAYTDFEMIVSLIIMVSGVMFFGYIIASVAASLANADAQRARFQEKLDSIKMFLGDVSVDEPLQKRIIAYYEYVWLRTKGIDPDSLFNGLPVSLAGDVTLSLYSDAISKISLFKDTEVSFIKMLSRCVKPMLFLKGEYVVRKHDIGQEMFFIHRGAVDVTSEDGSIVFDTMNAGAAFGEVALLFSCPRTASVRARVNSDVFRLDKQDLDRVLDLYPAIKKQVMEIAQERRQQAQKRSAAKISVEKTEDEAQESESAERVLESHEGSAVFKYTVHESPILEEEEEEEEGVEILKEEPEDGDAGITTSPVSDFHVEDSVQSSSDHDGLNSSNNAQSNVNYNNTEDGGADGEGEVKTTCLHRLRLFMRKTVNPRNRLYLHFHNLIAIIGVLLGWIIVFEVAFQDQSLALLAVSYACDVYFLFDMYFNCHLSFYDKHADLVEDFDKIWNNYKGLGLTLDVCAILPLELFCLAAPADKQMLVLSYLRLNRLIRLGRVSSFFSNWEKELNVNMLLVRMMKFGQVLLLLTHFFGCGWYMLACPPNTDGSSTLLSCSSDSWVVNSDVKQNSSFHAYGSAIYWTVATMTSTGYGDIHAYTYIEMCYAAVVMIMGKLMYGFILGNIASTLANADVTKVLFEETLDAIRGTMLDQDVPRELQRRVISYYDYTWKRNKGVSVKDLFYDAPPCMVSELFTTLTRPMFQTIALFNDADESFFRQLCMKVNFILYMPGDFIVRKGDVGQEVLYIHSGEVDVLDDESSGTVEQVLTAGDIMGEVNLVANLPRRVSIQARTHVDIYTLSQRDLDDVLDSYPTVRASVDEISMVRFRDFFHGSEGIHRGRSNRQMRRHTIRV